MSIILSLARTCCTLRRTRLHLVYRARYTYNNDRPVGRCSLCYWRVANYMMILRCTYIYLPTEDCDQCTTEKTGIVTRAHTHTHRSYDDDVNPPTKARHRQRWRRSKRLNFQPLLLPFDHSACAHICSTTRTSPTPNDFRVLVLKVF